jgi:hypothetical protein
LSIKLTHCAFLEKAEKSENATTKAVKPATGFPAANNPDKSHQARDVILINGADNHDETKTGVPELAAGGSQDVAMDDHAEKGDSEEEEEGEDVICKLTDLGTKKKLCPTTMVVIEPYGSVQCSRSLDRCGA